jgi:integrase/recombinase XerC
MSAPITPEFASLLTLAEKLGVSIEELAAAAASADSPSQMTVAEFLPFVDAATSEGARKTYRTYWRRLVEEMGDRQLAALKSTELESFILGTKAMAVKKPRSNSRYGVSAQESCVSALRRFFKLALQDGYVTKNPMKDVEKPPRLRPRRRSFSDDEVAEIYAVTTNGGDDPALDTLLLRFHLETGARRAGALSVRVRDLDVVP